MRILLRNIRNGLYLAHDDKWVEKIAEARDFERSTAVIPYAAARGLTNVEVVLAFPDERN